MSPSDRRNLDREAHSDLDASQTYRDSARSALRDDDCRLGLQQAALSYLHARLAVKGATITEGRTLIDKARDRSDEARVFFQQTLNQCSRRTTR